ncbi:2'-5' RNA ligase family protein [Kribbella qitaiheensis]|uniref:2'-5' RNA ligase family protein n=1 Tax=Kribbella qitaiheensis TaxID=1544730 RepID=A0A7G6WZ93_9ACTN|nr:2'-5' RNA ligase family protein [Kribbella qitaiheensis]QNE19308.1 2'-5' RNA ligase family protein [Kribbella qitaiheensis]
MSTFTFQSLLGYQTIRAVCTTLRPGHGRGYYVVRHNWWEHEGVSERNPWAARTGLTAILIAVPELAEFTDRWRSVSYSSARPTMALSELIPPHVTVLVPWLAEPMPDKVRRLEEALAAVQPFDLSFPTAGQFPNGTTWLRPEPFDQVSELIRIVLDTFPECPPYGGEHPDPHPHLTISSSGQGGSEGGARVLAEAEAALAAEEVPTIRLDDLTIWREGDDGIWQLTGSVPLGGIGLE